MDVYSNDTNLTSATFTPDAQTLSIFSAPYRKDLAVRNTSYNKGNLILFTAVLDQLLCHACVLYYLWR